MKYTDYIKAAKVVVSCDTLEQLDVAGAYLELVYKNCDVLPKALLHTQFIIKNKQLEDDVASGRCLSLEN